MKIIRSIISSVTEGVIKRFSGSGRPYETFTDRECFQHYGFTSRPLSGAEGIIIIEDGIIYLVASDDRRYRIQLQAGEVALYSDEGDVVHLKRNREIYIKGGNKVTVDSPEVNLSGARAGLRRLIDERFRTLFNSHVHTTGSGNTGAPTQTLEYADHATDKARGA